MVRCCHAHLQSLRHRSGRIYTHVSVPPGSNGSKDAPRAVNIDAWTAPLYHATSGYPGQILPGADDVVARSSLPSGRFRPGPTAHTIREIPCAKLQSSGQKERMGKEIKRARSVGMTPADGLGLLRLGHLYDEVPLREHARARKAPFLICRRIKTEEFPLRRSVQPAPRGTISQSFPPPQQRERPQRKYRDMLYSAACRFSEHVHNRKVVATVGFLPSENSFRSCPSQGAHIAG